MDCRLAHARTGSWKQWLDLYPAVCLRSMLGPASSSLWCVHLCKQQHPRHHGQLMPMHVARGCSRQARAGADCVAALHGSSTMMWRLCGHVHAHVAAAVTPVRCLALSKHSKAAGAPQSACHAVCHCHGRQLPAAGAPKQSVSGCVSWVLRLGPAPATKATRHSVHFGTVNSRTLGPDLLHHACVASCPCVYVRMTASCKGQRSSMLSLPVQPYCNTCGCPHRASPHTAVVACGDT
jgi:hypothetical protein